MLTIARSRVPAGDFRRGDLEALPFADESFDLVTGFNSLQYAANPVAALRDVGRVTKRAQVAAAATARGSPRSFRALR